MKYETSAIHDQRNRAGAGVFLHCVTTGRILLGLRGPDCSNPETWAPFGGMVEQNGESNAEAAFRELYEEAGVLVPDGARITDEPIYVNSGANGFKFYTFYGAVNAEPQVQINEESSGYAWFSRKSIPTINLHPGFRELLSVVGPTIWNSIQSGR